MKLFGGIIRSGFFNYIFPFAQALYLPRAIENYDYIPLLIIAGRMKTGMRINRINIAIASITNFSPAKTRLSNY
jgi:glutamate mutase epsilon subunit